MSTPRKITPLGIHCLARVSSVGCSALHGEHQEPQKSRTTTCPCVCDQSYVAPVTVGAVIGVAGPFGPLPKFVTDPMSCCKPHPASISAATNPTPATRRFTESPPDPRARALPGSGHLRQQLVSAHLDRRARR